MLKSRDAETQNKILAEFESCKYISTHSNAFPPKIYEELIQKLEGDIRMHIRTEHQMRIHIENL